MEDIIKVEGLTKQYGKFVAVDNISFIVKEGSLFAFLGPNGAGKSTTINMLSTVLEKTKGKIHIGGHEVGKEDNDVRKSIGMVFQHSMLDPLLTVKENRACKDNPYKYAWPVGKGKTCLSELWYKRSKKDKNSSNWKGEDAQWWIQSCIHEDE